MSQDYSYKAANDEIAMSAKSLKKSTGAYYTPDYLSNLIAQDTIFKWISNRTDSSIKNVNDLDKFSEIKRSKLLRDIKCVTILDPAVGEGAFLLAAANWLIKIRTSLGDNESEESCKQSIVEDCLFGVDLARHAIISCKNQIGSWATEGKETRMKMNIRCGNSLLGYIEVPGDVNSHSLAALDKSLYHKIKLIDLEKRLKINGSAKPFHWVVEFQDVFLGDTPGFDIVIGNPPYGSTLDPLDRRFIASMYPTNVGGGRRGTWNSAAHFLVRAISLMKEGGQLGFLVPNSFLRVKQFSKIREFVLYNTKLWKIVDEGSPFNDVTLEMVSLFSERSKIDDEHKISIESRRHGLEQSNVLSSQVFKESRVFSIYYDYIMEKILERGQRGLLVAGRGRDIPKDHVRKNQTSTFHVPYITSGRSVQRYGLKTKNIIYADRWFEQDSALKESYENEFLVATKNYRYPRCFLKPRGMIHGGGIVKITPLYHDADLQTLGLILNSKLVEQISIRYLTNYSQLTCCLNTGIMEELPLVIPKQPKVYRGLFEKLTQAYAESAEDSDKMCIPALERLSDALVYSLYFGNNSLERRVAKGINDLYSISQEPLVKEMIDEILAGPIVEVLERLGSFPATRKLLRY